MSYIQFYEFHPGHGRRIIHNLYVNKSVVTANQFVAAAEYMKDTDYIFSQTRVQLPGFVNPFVVLSKETSYAIAKSPCTDFIGVSCCDEDYMVLKSYNDDLWIVYNIEEDIARVFVSTDQ